MDTNMVLNASFNELVFENRHKDYGAYQIRKRYSRNVLLSGFLAVVLFTAALCTYFITMPDANAFGGPPAIPPRVSDTLTINMIQDKKPEKKAEQVKPQPRQGNPNTITSTIVVKDSIIPVSMNDTAGSVKGIKGGIGDPKDTLTVAGDPCPTCGDTVSPKPPRRVAWLPNPPKDPGLDAFFVKNIRYPQLAKDRGIEGVVYLTFIVDTKGDVRDIKIAKGVDPLLDKEVLRVAKFMPKWDPVKDDNGEIVEFQYNKPVRFTLSK